MADEKKKLSTADILAQARAQAAGDSGESDSSQEEQAEETASAPESPSTDAPQSTSDILAAARAQASGGDDAPAQSGGGDAPKETSDILAAARAQAAGGDEGKPAAGGAAPKGTSDILAAARAQAGQGGGESKPAAGKPAAKSKAAAKPVGDLPPVKDMVEAMKTGKRAEEVKSGPAKPKIPTRPPKSPKPAAKAPQGESRRNVLLAVCGSVYDAECARRASQQIQDRSPDRLRVWDGGDEMEGPVWRLGREYRIQRAQDDLCSRFGLYSSRLYSELARWRTEV